MAAKKTPTKTTKKPAAKPRASRAKKAPSGPSPEDLARQELSDARVRAAALRDQVTQCERELESARTISTTDHRIPAVAAASERLATARAAAMEAAEQFAALKTAMSTGNFHRIPALGRVPGRKPASAAAKRGEPRR
jgi:hypothetical protein